MLRNGLPLAFNSTLLETLSSKQCLLWPVGAHSCHVASLAI